MWVASLIWNSCSTQIDVFAEEKDAWKYLAVYIESAFGDSLKEAFPPAAVMFREHDYKKYVEIWEGWEYKDEEVTLDIVEVTLKGNQQEAVPETKVTENFHPGKEHVKITAEFRVDVPLNPLVVATIIDLVDHVEKDWALHSIPVLDSKIEIVWVDDAGNYVKPDDKLLGELLESSTSWKREESA